MGFSVEFKGYYEELSPYVGWNIHFVCFHLSLNL